MASMLSRFRRKQLPACKPSRSSRLLLEQLEARTVPASLQLSLPNPIVEGVTGIGTVTRAQTDVSQALTVNLVSSDTQQATVPAYVVIQAGQASANFNITALYDWYADGTQNVTISAAAELPTHTQPDPTFGGDGSVSQASITQDVALQPDGKIVTAGLRYNGGSSNFFDFAVSRYNADGTPDTSFGGTGTVFTDVSGQSDKARAVLIQPDGKILVGGTGGDGPHYFFVLARYNSDGSLDTDFGGGGTLMSDPFPTSTYNEIWDLALQADGSILAGGNVTIGNDVRFAVARFHQWGQLDMSFGSNGIATTNPTTSTSDRGYGILVQPDGRIVLAGGSAGGNSISRFALSRFNWNGSVDTSFGSGGTAMTDLPGTFEQAFDAALQADGKIVAVGQVNPGTSPGPHNFALARYNSDGSLDSSFGSGGFVSTNMGGNDSAQEVALTPDGRIVVIGGGVTTSNSTMYMQIAHYNANGTLSNAYISRGNGVQGTGLAVQPDGKVVAVSSQNSGYGGFVERYESVILLTDSDTVAVLDETNPLVQSDAYGVGEDMTFYSYYNYPNYGVLTNDYSQNGNLTATLVSGPSHGSLILDADGSFVYTPDLEYNGPDSFVYRATDDLGLFGEATVSLTVWAMDDPIAVLVPGPQTIAEDTSITFSTANGNGITIIDLDTPRVLVALMVQDAIVTLPSIEGLEFYPGYGNNSSTVAFYADDPAEANAALDGVIVTPNPNYNGTIYFSVYAEDTTSTSYYNTTSSSVQITVTPVNDAPVAGDDSYEVSEDYSYNGYGLLGNDNDPDWGDMLSAVLVSGPAHGTVNVNSNGNFTYTPDLNYNGPDSFTYSAMDSGGLLSAPATVSLTVWPMDDAIQVTGPAPHTIAEDTSLTFSTANGNAFTVIDLESPRILVDVFVSEGVLNLSTTEGLEFPDPAFLNGGREVVFYADNPAEANAALDGLVFTPNANFNGQVYLNVWVEDQTFVSQSVSAYSYVQITVSPVNDAPVAASDSYIVEAGVPFTTSPYYPYGGGSGPGVLANDVDVDWDSLSAVLVSGPAHGTLTFNSDGGFTYTADSTYTGIDTFTYSVSDGQLQSNLASVTLNVIQNRPPVGVGDAYSVNEDGTLLVAAPGILGNDSDPDGQPLTAQLVSSQSHGTLTFNADGSFTYTPAANYNGPDEFSYRAYDGVHFSDPVAVNLIVNPVNDFAAAGNDSYSVDEDNTLTIAAPGVLTNDSDADGDALSALLVAGPSHGTLSFNVDGSFTYTPNANYNGSDRFTYKVFDGLAASNVATVLITVNAINDAPIAVNDAYILNEDQVLNIAPIPGVTSLTMVSEPGDYIGQGQTYSYTTQTGNFTANRNFDNGVSIFYSGSGHTWSLHFAAPFEARLTAGTYLNATRWPFQASNVPGLSVYGNGRGSNTLTGSFIVHQALYAGDGSVLRFSASFEQHNEGVAPALTGTINFNTGDGPSGVLINDSDVEGSPLTLSVVSGPAHGTLAMNVDGSFKYTPTANYNGQDSFTYKVSDGALESNIATVSLTVNAVNDFPTANADFYTVAEDNLLSAAAPGVLANDSDVDGDPLTATLVTSTTHGTLVLNSNGSFTYTPQANYNGSDSFQYAARDGQSFSFIRTVTINVTSVNDAPTAGNDAYTTDEDTPLTVAPAGVLTNDSDVEGSTLSAILVNGPANGTLTLNSNGTFTYTPNANYHGSDSFTYKANDGSLDSNVATVTLTINSVNDVPSAGDDGYTLAEDTVLVGGILANDSDVDGDALAAILVTGPAHGALSLNADGSFTFTPDANYNGSDSFTYKANDGSLDSNVATVSLTITPVNDVPAADAGSDQTVNEGSIVVFNGAASDVDGDVLSYLWSFGDGATSTGAACAHLYADNGTYTVTLTVSDGQGGVTSDSLEVTVLNVSPTLTLSGASAVNEGSTYTLNLSSSDPGQDTISGWTINWGDGNIETVTGNPGSVTHTYADGPVGRVISATANDEDGTYAAGNSLSVMVNNVAPTAGISGPSTGARGQMRTFTFDATDPSQADQAGPFTFDINWGDGSSEWSTGSANQQVGHIYNTTGTFTVQVTATDKDGGVSTTVKKTITISAVDLQGGTLVIGGTTANDNITVSPADTSGNLAVTINGVLQGTFAPPAQIVIYGQGGGDQIKLNSKKFGQPTYYVTVQAVLFGDGGNDTLDARGSTANNVLVGGDGIDQLQGGSGRDLLLGGAGVDTLHGNGGDDLVIGNSTDYDSNAAALNAVMAEWGRTDASYTTRLNHLNGSAAGGLNGGYFLNSTTVHDDAAIDQLYGEAGIDWYFYTASGSNKDKLNDLVSGEMATAL